MNWIVSFHWVSLQCIVHSGIVHSISVHGCMGLFVHIMRLMILSHRFEASLTKIQRCNVHSIFVTVFRSETFQSALGHLESLLMYWCQYRRGNFRQTDGKASQHCTQTYFPLSDFMACFDTQSFIKQ